VRLTLTVWRQKDAKSEGKFVTYDAPDISPDMSFLEMLDVVNQRSSRRPRTQSLSTTTAVKASAGCAESW